MTKKESENISLTFALNKITTEQFAVIEDIEINEDTIRLGTSFRFAANENDKLIAVFARFSFDSNDKPFIIIEAGCHFKIVDQSWKEMLDVETNTLIVPKVFLNHFAMLTVGTTRGILHAKTENTCYNKYVLPTINVTEIILADAEFHFVNKK